jgi:hypothetical protein
MESISRVAYKYGLPLKIKIWGSAIPTYGIIGLPFLYERFLPTKLFWEYAKVEKINKSKWVQKLAFIVLYGVKIFNNYSGKLIGS